MSNKLKLAIGFIILAIAHFMSGCSEIKQIAKAKQKLDSNPIEAAKYCADKFPVKETTIYLPGKIQIDTMWEAISEYVPFDCPPSDTVVRYKVTVQFKEKVITKQKTDTVTVYRENTARIAALIGQLSVSQDREKKISDKLVKAKKELTYFWCFLVACFIALGVWGYFKIKTGAISGILSKLK